MSRATVHRVTAMLLLDLRVWASSSWIADLAWGIRVGTLTGVATVVAVSTVPPALGWW